jgi:DNA-binding CsgD family transcriptional regulator
MNRRGFLVSLAAGLLAVAVGGPGPARLRVAELRLSPRQRQVLALCARDPSAAEIGRELYISPHTVHTHMENILAKLARHYRLEAAPSAMENLWS